MRFVGEPAFVLHARAWRETSLLVEVLSAEHGRVGLVARGVQGPKKHVPMIRRLSHSAGRLVLFWKAVYTQQD